MRASHASLGTGTKVIVAGTPITVVQTASLAEAVSGTSVTASFPAATTSGNTLIAVYLTFAGNGPITVSASTNNSQALVQAVGINNNNAADNATIFHLYNASSTTSITATQSPVDVSVAEGLLTIMEVHPVTLDVFASNIGNAGPNTISVPSTNVQNEIVIVGTAQYDGSITSPPSGYTALGYLNYGASYSGAAYKIITTTGAQAATYDSLTVTDYWATVMATYSGN